MVRMYVRKTTRGCWDERQMVAAMNAILARKMGYSKASKTFGTPRSTLRRIMKRLEANGEVNIRVPLGTNASVFTKEEEKYLVSHLNSMNNRLFTVTIPIKRKLAYQLATKKHKSHKWKDNVAGREWLREFVKRHKLNCQSIGRPVTKTKLACFNKEGVMKFYEVLGELYLKYNFTADRIYNCDETSISCDTNKSQVNGIAIATDSAKPSVSSGTTRESGHTITVEVCMSATGLFMPLLFVFPLKSHEPQLTSNLILPCYAQCNETGWMSSDIFAGWLKHFVKFSRATKENPVLLLMDGDSSHTASLELLETAENNGVIMLCLPEYCTHRIGPLEVEFFGILSKHYVSASKEWTSGHAGQLPGIAEIPLLFEQAFIQSATLATAVVAFRKTGIWPFKPNTFSDHDFTGIGTSLLPHQIAASIQHNNQTTNINNNNNNTNNNNHTSNNNNHHNNNNNNNNLSVQSQTNPNNSKDSNVSVTPGSSWKPTNNCAPPVNEMRTSVHPNCVESVSGPHLQPLRKRMYPPPEPQPVPLQIYQSNNYQDSPLPGPSWKPPLVNPVNEMKLSAASAYVEAVLGGPQNHPARNMEQPEGPGCSNDPAMYSISLPHMFL